MLKKMLSYIIKGNIFALLGQYKHKKRLAYEGLYSIKTHSRHKGYCGKNQKTYAPAKSGSNFPRPTHGKGFFSGSDMLTSNV